MLGHAGHIRLIDIARKAGVTPAVVSQVLNNRTSTIRVSVQKREAILDIAKQLEYMPDINARALRGETTGMIGVLADSHAPDTAHQLIQQLETKAMEAGLRVLIGEYHDNAKAMEKAFRQLCRHGVDSLVVLSHDYPDLNDEITSIFAHSPRTLFIGKPFIPGCPHIVIDRAAGIREAVRHLHEKGRERIAHLVMKNVKTFDNLDKFQGYQEEIQSGHEIIIPCNWPTADMDALRLELRNSVQEIIIPRKVDGLIAINDLLALMLYGELARFGLRVPEDIAIVGHDNLLVSQCMSPKLTTIDENKELVTSSILDVINAFERNETPITATVTVPTRLVIRDST